VGTFSFSRPAASSIAAPEFFFVWFGIRVARVPQKMLCDGVQVSRRSEPRVAPFGRGACRPCDPAQPSLRVGCLLCTG
jgi:hypothetical protein